MLKIGLTGGIGSGKSTVAGIFSVLSIPILYADEVSKKLMNEDAGLISSIKKHFGDECYINGTLNREFLAKKVFNDNTQLQLLNSLVHPATIQYAEEWMKLQTTPYVIKEAALIFESGSQKNLDFVIGVKAPLELRIKRAMHRDGLTKEQILARMDKQLDEDAKMNLCDFVIVNDEHSLVIPQVLALHQKFLQKS
ncbi:dephospho-CoA kinase [soil metagenome]